MLMRCHRHRVCMFRFCTHSIDHEGECEYSLPHTNCVVRETVTCVPAWKGNFIVSPIPDIFNQRHLIVSPTGFDLRRDPAGDGSYGAARSKRVKTQTLRYTHIGFDFLCKPGQLVYSPFDGTIVKPRYPYADMHLGGVEIKGKHICVVMFYLQLDPNLIGRQVHQGSVVGIAQDVAKYHNSKRMLPHIHLQVEHCDPVLLFPQSLKGECT